MNPFLSRKIHHILATSVLMTTNVAAERITLSLHTCKVTEKDE